MTQIEVKLKDEYCLNALKKNKRYYLIGYQNLV